MRNKPKMIEGFWWTLPVSKESVDFSSIEEYAQANGFRPKEEFHITIIGSVARDVLVEFLDMQDAYGKKSLLDSINNLMNRYDWKFELTNFYHIKRVHEGVLKESIISPVMLKDIQVLYGALNQILKADLPIQFPHITFYTKGPRNKDGYYGIPLPSEDVFKESIYKKLN